MFVAIASLASFVGGELSLLKLGSLFWLVSVGLLCVKLLLKAKLAQLLYLRSNTCVFACRLGLKRSQDKSIHRVCTCFVCVLMMWSDWGVAALKRVQFFISAEGLKIDFFFGIIKYREQFGANFLSTLCTHGLDHSLTWRFVSILPSNLLRNSRKLGTNF